MRELTLLAELYRAGLVDECTLIVCPAVHGSAISRFVDIDGETVLALDEARAFGSGWVLLRYRGAGTAPQ